MGPYGLRPATRPKYSGPLGCPMLTASQASADPCSHEPPAYESVPLGSLTVAVAVPPVNPTFGDGEGAAEADGDADANAEAAGPGEAGGAAVEPSGLANADGEGEADGDADGAREADASRVAPGEGGAAVEPCGEARPVGAVVPAGEAHAETASPRSRARIGTGRHVRPRRAVRPVPVAPPADDGPGGFRALRRRRAACRSPPHLRSRRSGRGRPRRAGCSRSRPARPSAGGRPCSTSPRAAP